MASVNSLLLPLGEEKEIFFLLSAPSARFGAAGVDGSDWAAGKEGGDLEDHFQPGALVFASKRSRMCSREGTDSSLLDGSRRIVIENPGMLRLVC